MDTTFVSQRFSKNSSTLNAFRSAQGLPPLPESYDVAIVNDGGKAKIRHRLTVGALVVVGGYLLLHAFGFVKRKGGVKG